MNKITIYLTQTCGFCHAAKRLLEERGISYDEIDISSDLESRGEMMRKSNGMRTVPQIFLNNKHVGGFSELYTLQQSGELEKVVERLTNVERRTFSTILYR